MGSQSIRNMVFRGCHGCNDHEQHTPQPFRVSVTLQADFQTSAISDNLEDTINWSVVRKAVKEVIESGSYKLVEALALAILNRLLVDPKVTSAQVTVEKLEAWSDGNGIPSITLERAKEL